MKLPKHLNLIFSEIFKFLIYMKVKSNLNKQIKRSFTLFPVFIPSSVGTILGNKKITIFFEELAVSKLNFLIALVPNRQNVQNALLKVPEIHSFCEICSMNFADFSLPLGGIPIFFSNSRQCKGRIEIGRQPIHSPIPIPNVFFMTLQRKSNIWVKYVHPMKEVFYFLLLSLPLSLPLLQIQLERDLLTTYGDLKEFRLIAFFFVTVVRLQSASFCHLSFQRKSIPFPVRFTIVLSANWPLLLVCFSKISISVSDLY